MMSFIVLENPLNFKFFNMVAALSKENPMLCTKEVPLPKGSSPYSTFLVVMLLSSKSFQKKNLCFPDPLLHVGVYINPTQYAMIFLISKSVPSISSQPCILKSLKLNLMKKNKSFLIPFSMWLCIH